MEKKRRILDWVLWGIMYVTLIALFMVLIVWLLSQGKDGDITVWNFIGLAGFGVVAWLFKALGIGEKEEDKKEVKA